MSTLKVDGIRSNSASSDAITLAGDGTCTANITNSLSNRNLAINGACLISQRGTSSTDSGYATVDRFKVSHTGTDELPTQAQVTVASGTTPYTLGFRKALKITNGNQTSGAGADDMITYAYRIEAQDMNNSGWNYTSTSSYLTLSFWIKSSVAQSFGGFIRTHDGTQMTFPFETGSLSADTWTKITKTIPGHASLSFDYDTNCGLEIIIGGFWGTDYTTSDKTLDAWSAYSNDARLRDNTSTWFTTNDSTLELTGLQVEVSDHATDFEHRSYAQELELCKRYFQIIKGDTNDYTGLSAYSESTTSLRIPVQLFPAMRAAFTVNKSGTFRFQGATNDSADSTEAFSLEGGNTTFNACTIRSTAYSSMGAADRPGNLQFRSDGASLKFDAEI